MTVRHSSRKIIIPIFLVYSVLSLGQSIMAGQRIEEAAKSYPSYPENVNATKLENNKVKIEWQRSGDHVVYHIFRYCGYSRPDRDTPNWQLIGCTNDFVFFDSNRPADECYYSITSFNTWGNESSRSKIVKAEPNRIK